MEWNYWSIPKLHFVQFWSLEMEKYLHPTLYDECNYLDTLWLRLNQVSKWGSLQPLRSGWQYCVFALANHAIVISLHQFSRQHLACAGKTLSRALSDNKRVLIPSLFLCNGATSSALLGFIFSTKMKWSSTMTGTQIAIGSVASDVYQNLSPSSVAYMRRWTGSALIQIMACRLFGAKPLP